MVKHLKALEASFRSLRGDRFEFPVVVISGANCSAAGIEEHRAIAALSARGEHLVAPSGGHWVHFDAPEMVEEAIRRVVTAAKGTG